MRRLVSAVANGGEAKVLRIAARLRVVADVPAPGQTDVAFSAHTRQPGSRNVAAPFEPVIATGMLRPVGRDARTEHALWRRSTAARGLDPPVGESQIRLRGGRRRLAAPREYLNTYRSPVRRRGDAVRRPVHQSRRSSLFGSARQVLGLS